ncbi:MAG: hypothetical protein MUC62_04485 [Candidatus Thermoplasmatota archaeon]|jgi:hypothetical protein|nr:hypothetical protein [Candidatus Thermoplasmatota archaeon]
MYKIKRLLTSTIALMVLISFFIIFLNDVSANSAPVWNKDDKIVSFFFLFISNLPLNFIYIILLFQIIPKGRKTSKKPISFILSLLGIIFFITIIGAITDIFIANIPNQENGNAIDFNNISHNILFNLPAFFVIFLSFFVPLKLILKQGFFNSISISIIISIINLISWLLLFPKTYEEDVFCFFIGGIYLTSIILGLIFMKWYRKKFNK